jgi:Type I restriction enzyme R protein N terminus (HSDR_N)/N-6 DNA Methylase
MTALLAPTWLNNSLYDDTFVQRLLNEQTTTPAVQALHDWLGIHLPAALNPSSNEAQLEDEFVKPLIAQLGWHSVKQINLSAQGKSQELDWALTLNQSAADRLKTNRDPQHITAVVECKAPSVALDNGKANASNPHFQLMQYLNMYRVPYGFLTNGRLWRFYNNDTLHAKKAFLEFDLPALLALPDSQEQARAVGLFTQFFALASYAPVVQGAASSIQATASRAADYAFELESNLKSVIYGTDGEDSAFERIGQAIHARNPAASMGEVYENAMVLLYRLLFVVYFEDKNRALLQAHPHYARHSLASIVEGLKTAPPALHDGMFALRHLFTILDEGAEDIRVPLFNGGLFDPDQSPLLNVGKLLSNAQLQQLLAQLLYKTQGGAALFDTRRDYKNMTITHLGRIYEGLLEYRFIQAEGERPTYVEYKKGKTTTDAYFSAYALAAFKKTAIKDKSIVILREIALSEGQIYLRSASNSRKTTASYYTPTELSSFLIKAGIDRAIDVDGKAIASLTILDNACGSGHFLVEALGYLSQRALASLDTQPELQALLEQERSKITEQLQALHLDTALDDAQILKRALLKRCIYGVDLNPFAVELTRLSLWIDSFIFGTPLSFIEHHIQHGNALMGATQAEFLAHTRRGEAQNLFAEQDLHTEFTALGDVMSELSHLRDTTSFEINQSKAIYKHKIVPKLSKLSRALSLVSTRQMWAAQGRRKDVAALDAQDMLAAALFDTGLTIQIDLPNPSPEDAMVLDKSNARRSQLAVMVAQVETCAAQHHFLHYEIAFPEVFASSDPAQRGFDIICGNPPWDKTVFSDNDFFPQYHSNYRSLKNSEKAAVQAEQLAKPAIKAAYDAAQQAASSAYEYYKIGFPLNDGAVDDNLFRLFVERNVGLLKSGGSLNYVLPSALMFEESSQVLRRHILGKMHMPFFYSFENREPLFPEVDSRFKFAMMQVVNTPLTPAQSSTYTIDTAFYLGRTADLDQTRAQDSRHISYPLTTLKALSPQQWSLLELRTAQDIAILQRCYDAFDPLHERWMNFRRELDMTDDKDLFLESPTADSLPLYEGKMIWQYNAAFEKPQYWLNPTDFDQRLASKEAHRMAQDLGVPKSKLLESQLASVRFDREFFKLAFRRVARDTDERTLIFSLLPPGCGSGHSLFASVPKTYVLQGTAPVGWASAHHFTPQTEPAGGLKPTLPNPQTGTTGAVGIQETSALRHLFALAWFNSLPCDWLARFMVQINVSQTYLYRLPMPQPTDAQILATPAYSTLARNAALLTLHSDWVAFAPLAATFGLTKGDLPATEEAYDRLRYDNDVLVAQCYCLNSQDLRHILAGFPVMQNKRFEYTTFFARDF